MNSVNKLGHLRAFSKKFLRFPVCQQNALMSTYTFQTVYTFVFAIVYEHIYCEQTWPFL